MSFIVLDGIDGCGKSTQAALLAGRITALGRAVCHLREPGSTALGEALRELLLGGAMRVSPEVETLLFTAARRQLVDERVLPALERGEVVICERYDPSTYAYQAFGSGLDPDRLRRLLAEWVGTLPERAVVLDVAPDRAAARRRGRTEDRIEARGLEYQERVAQGFRRFVEETPYAVLVDGEGEVEEVAERIWEEVRGVL